MGDGQLDILWQRLAALGKLLDHHVEDVVKLLLRRLGRAADRVAALNGRHVGDATPVVVPMADHMVVEERFHDGKLAQPWEKLKRNAACAVLVMADWLYGSLAGPIRQM